MANELSGSTQYREGLQRAGRILAGARQIVALTGAGLSTRSGLPDFRSPGNGLYERAEAGSGWLSEGATLKGFTRQPDAFYSRFRPFLQALLAAEPNAAHYALAVIERGGRLRTLITQNVDMLHQKAGSQNVLEIHGSLREAVCLTCYQATEGLPVWEKLIKDGETPRCEHCGGVMKPGVILSGEQMPHKIVLESRNALRGCDALLAAGTSLAGGPVLAMVEAVHKRGVPVIMVNLTATIFDSAAAVALQADVADALPVLAELMG